MRNTIKKILKEDLEYWGYDGKTLGPIKEDDFEWVEKTTDDLPLDEIRELTKSYDKVHSIKVKLEKYLENKVGLETFEYETEVPDRVKYHNNYIVEEIRSIYNEVNNIDSSLFELQSPLEHLEYLVTGIDTTED